MQVPLLSASAAVLQPGLCCETVGCCSCSEETRASLAKRTGEGAWVGNIAKAEIYGTLERSVWFAVHAGVHRARSNAMNRHPSLLQH